jgi:hypothetical protein
MTTTTDRAKAADCDLLAEVTTPDGVAVGPWRADTNGHLVRTLSDGRAQRGNGDITTPPDVTPPADISGMTTTTVQINPYPDIRPPSGATTVDDWQSFDPQPYRVVIGADRTVTDHVARVSPSAIQWADGSIDGHGEIELPHVYVFGLDETGPLNSDQARELAAALLETAAEIDGWVSR